jgi:hypothetical protein
MLMTASDVASIAKPWEVQHKVTPARHIAEMRKDAFCMVLSLRTVYRFKQKDDLHV